MIIYEALGRFFNWLWQRPEGRIDRLTYITNLVLATLVVLIYFGVLLVLTEVVAATSQIAFIKLSFGLAAIVLVVLGGISWFWKVISLQIQRLHDVGFHWWAIIIFWSVGTLSVFASGAFSNRDMIALAWIFGGISWLPDLYLIFYPGNRRTNEFGEDPVALKQARRAEVETEPEPAKEVKKATPAKKKKPAAKKTPAKKATSRAKTTGKKPVSKKTATKKKTTKTTKKK